MNGVALRRGGTSTYGSGAPRPMNLVLARWARGAGIIAADEERMSREAVPLVASKPAAVLLQLMTQPMPDVADRKRLELQKIPFALPDRR